MIAWILLGVDLVAMIVPFAVVPVASALTGAPGAALFERAFDGIAPARRARGTG